MDVSGTEWNNAGKGMPVKVVYEKNNPGICKLLLSAKAAMEYMDKSKKLYPGIKDLEKFARTDDVKEQQQLLGEGWKRRSVEGHDTSSILFYNTITSDNLLVSAIGNIYINENEQDYAYRNIMTEARKSMKVVYDSMGTNTKQGVLLQNDSMQIRFQEYSKASKIKGEYGIMGYSSKKIYCFGFAKKGGFIILPGDLEQRDETRDLKKALQGK